MCGGQSTILVCAKETRIMESNMSTNSLRGEIQTKKMRTICKVVDIP